MGQSASAWVLELLQQQSIQVLVVFVVVLTVTTLGTRRRPHMAQALWGVVLLKCVIPPVFAIPTGVFCWSLWIDQWRPREIIELIPVEQAALRASADEEPIDEFVLAPLPNTDAGSVKRSATIDESDLGRIPLIIITVWIIGMILRCIQIVRQVRSVFQADSSASLRGQ